MHVCVSGVHIVRKSTQTGGMKLDLSSSNKNNKNSEAQCTTFGFVLRPLCLNPCLQEVVNNSYHSSLKDIFGLEISGMYTTKKLVLKESHAVISGIHSFESQQLKF